MGNGTDPLPPNWILSIFGEFFSFLFLFDLCYALSILGACLDGMVPFRWPIQMTFSFHFEKV